MHVIDGLQLDTRKMIEKSRLGKNMSQQQLANTLNVKVDIIKNIENGSLKPNPQLLNKLKSLLNFKLK